MQSTEIKHFNPVRLCVIGNLIGRNSGYITTQGLVLADLLSKEGHRVVSASSKINRVFRLIEIAATIILNRNVIDVLILEVYSGLNFFMSVTVSLLGHLFGIPMIFVLHGGKLPEFSRKHPGWAKRVLTKADILVAPSPFMVKELGNLGLSIRVIRNIVEIDDIPCRIRRKIEPKLVWMRAFHPTYNPQMAIKVLNSVRNSYPNASLVMAGLDKGLEPEIKKMVNDFGLQEAVRFPGFLDRNAKIKEFSEADIYLNTNRLDNMPVSVIEACAFGLPVIATNVGGLPDLIDNGTNGLLVPDDDVEKMVNAITSLLEDSDTTEKLSRNARALAELSSWSTVRICWNELFAEIMKADAHKQTENYFSLHTSNK